MTRRQEVERLYSKISKIVNKGKFYTQTYYDFIDDIIKNSQFDSLKDTLYTKYKIDVDSYDTVDMLKTDSFKIILSYNISKSVRDLDSLFKNKNVFTTGPQFFDSDSKKYLGDIQQFDTITMSSVLEIYTFYPSRMKSAIPSFDVNYQNSISYELDTIVYYGDKLYKCYEPYVWNKNNQITPTYSNYWNEIFAGTQSNHIISDQTINLLDRYSLSIDILRSYDFKY